jgi:hypothetical protein
VAVHAEAQALVVSGPVAVLDRVLEELAGHHRDGVAAVDVGEHRDEAAVHRGAEEITLRQWLWTGRSIKKVKGCMARPT